MTFSRFCELHTCIQIWKSYFKLRPHYDHGVADEFYDITAKLLKRFYHTLQIAVDAKSEIFISSEALFCTRLGEVSETTYIGKHNDCLHRLQLRQLYLICGDSWLPLLLNEQMLQHKRGYIFIEPIYKFHLRRRLLLFLFLLFFHNF